MLNAKQIRDYNTMITKGVTPDLIKLKELEIERTKIEVAMKEADKWNGTLPSTMLAPAGGESVPIIMGLNNK